LTSSDREQNICDRRRNIDMPELDKILRMRTVLERTGLSRSTLYRKMHDGTFPNQVQISEHCRGWHESAINRWIADPASYRETNALAGTGGGTPSGQRLPV
jgi:prophage regulatory protein